MAFPFCTHLLQITNKFAPETSDWPIATICDVTYIIHELSFLALLKVKCKKLVSIHELSHSYVIGDK